MRINGKPIQIAHTMVEIEGRCRQIAVLHPSKVFVQAKGQTAFK